MKKLTKMLMLGVVVLPCMILAACGAMMVKGKDFEYNNSTVEFTGTGSASQTALENEKQTLKTKYKNVTFKFGEDGKATFGEDTVYYTQDGSKINLYTDAEKTTAYTNFNGTDVKISVDNQNIKITFNGDADNKNENYKYTVTFKQTTKTEK